MLKINTDEKLLKPVVVRIKSLAASERKITAEILGCIQEIELQKIHLGMGYPSLLEFLRQECGYSETAALRRIDAARLLEQIPELQSHIRSGNLNLTQVSTVACGVRQKEKQGVKVDLQLKKDLLQAIQHKRSYEAQQLTAQMLELPVLTQEKSRVQADESYRVEMRFSKNEMGIINRAREILGHVRPGMSLQELVVELATRFVATKAPERVGRERKVPAAPRSAVAAAEVGPAAATGSAAGTEATQVRVAASQTKVSGAAVSEGATAIAVPAAVDGAESEATAASTVASATAGSALQVSDVAASELGAAAVDTRAAAAMRNQAERKREKPNREKANRIYSATESDNQTQSQICSATESGSKTSSRIQSGVANGGVQIFTHSATGLRRQRDLDSANQINGRNWSRMQKEVRSHEKSSIKDKPQAGLKRKSLPTSLRREIFQRDQCCQWRDPKTGRKCESRHLLEIDHIQPWHCGGGNESSNLRILCRAHNIYRFEMQL